MPTARLKPINVFVPFGKIERRDDDVLVVEGYAFVNPIVRGERWNLKRAAMEAATPDYLKFGAIREMHQPIAAGTTLRADWDEKGCRLVAEIVDREAQRKIERKVYKGFSVGVTPIGPARGDDIDRCDWIETSLVDRPKDPDALFSLYRAEGFDPDAEVEVEILDAPAAASSSTGDPPPTPDAASTAAPILSLPDPLAEATVAADASAVPPADAGSHAAPEPTEPAGGTSSSAEEPRTALAEAFRAAGLSPALAASVEVVPAETASSIPVVTADGTTDRAQTSATVPVRENLEKKSGDCRRKEGEMCRGECSKERCAMPEEKRVADVERVIKHEDGKWCVYSESGKKLGTHDTEAEAKDQLQAIEISKHQDEPGATQPKDEKRAATITEGRYQELREMVRAGRVEELTAEEAPAFLARLKADILTEAAATPADPPPVDVERAAPSAEPVSSSQLSVVSPAVGTDNSQLTTDDSALNRLQVAHEETLTRLATALGERDQALTRLAEAETKIQRQNELLAQPRDVPPARFLHPLSREFTTNLGNQGEERIARLRQEYDAAAAEAAAEKDGDRTKRDRAVERMIARAAELAHHGIYLKP